ncbi:MAG: NAD-dependent epimerase/dehydratase family protein [Candidatus Sumerlaeia bacterium]|nr:NAD-dependent epimerase/dehydratase family protein [Candidatus Sumerlaeia bacterium]
MKRAILTGATGYVGCHLVDALAQREVEMVVPARATTPADAREFVHSRGATTHVVDYARGEGVREAFRGCDVWFHLIGSIQRLRKDPFEWRHREVTARLVAVARQAGVGRVVFLTALGTGSRANNIYHRTKWEAEREVLQSGLAGALIRPSLIVGRSVGPRDSKLVMRYIRMMRERGRAVVLGDGSNRIQPIDVRDLVECMVRAAERENRNVAVYELGGPEPVAFREFVRRLGRAIGLDVPIRSLPLWLASLAARWYEWTREAPPVTREQVALCCVDNVCAPDSVEQQFGFAARPLDESLATYRTEQDGAA